nr:hypothetical protein WMHIBSEC_WMHIBSEC_CDS_0078 [Caudoviricetes sp.]CAI9751844.1 hypothetical protein AZFZUZMX_AZFZUZMX_CDS_0078 [Caudoviricetes sp.]
MIPPLVCVINNQLLIFRQFDLLILLRLEYPHFLYSTE